MKTGQAGSVLQPLCWLEPSPNHRRADRVTGTAARDHTADNSAGLRAGSPINVTALRKTPPFSSFRRTTLSSACRQQSGPPWIWDTGSHVLWPRCCFPWLPGPCTVRDAVKPWVMCCCTRIKARSLGVEDGVGCC